MTPKYIPGTRAKYRVPMSGEIRVTKLTRGFPGGIWWGESDDGNAVVTIMESWIIEILGPVQGRVEAVKKPVAAQGELF